VSGRFAGKVVVITGASMGVGAATARAFASEGARLVLVARGREALERLVAELGGTTEAVAECLDVSDGPGCAAMLERAAQRHGRIDALVNNAGLHVRGAFERIAPEDIARMIEVNLTAPLRLARLVLPHLERAGGGAIVNVASLSGVAPLPGAATYTGTKFGLRGFSFALAEEVRDRNISVSLVSPGPIDTGFLMDHLDEVEDLSFSQPMSTAGQVAQAVVRAASGPSTEIAMPRMSARLATLAYLFPPLARRLRPALRRKGARAKEKYRNR
jgi:short-subunit dehydrogenase